MLVFVYIQLLSVMVCLPLCLFSLSFLSVFSALSVFILCLSFSLLILVFVHSVFVSVYSVSVCSFCLWLPVDFFLYSCQ